MRDIESGFLDRLALTPMRAGALVIAQISGAIFIALASSLLYVAIGLTFGVDFKAGALGILALLALAGWTASSFATLGAWLALRSGSSEALQGVFPLLFATLFLPRSTCHASSSRRLVSRHHAREPRLVHGRRHAQPHHHRLGRRRAHRGSLRESL